jgi:hypothetical protein
MSENESPDFIELGRRLFGCAALPFARVPAEIGVSVSFAWELVKDGKLPVTYLGPKKIVVQTADLARLITERSRNPRVRQSPRFKGAKS